MKTKNNTIFEAKVSYGLKLNYKPFLLSGTLISVWMISFYFHILYGKSVLNLVGIIGGITIIIEIITVHILANYRTVKLKEGSQNPIIEISNFNDVIYKEEIGEFLFWWSYNKIDIKTKSYSVSSGSYSADEIAGYSSLKNSLGATSEPLPRTLYLEIISNNGQSITLYESLYTIQKIPKDWLYNNSYKEDLIEGYKLENLVVAIKDNYKKKDYK